MIGIVNKRDFKRMGRNIVYIGRPSILGNPYKLSKFGREESIRLYEIWLRAKITDGKVVKKEIDRLARIARKGDLFLACWCYPKRCHGDVIKRIIEEINEEHDPTYELASDIGGDMSDGAFWALYNELGG